jgi:DNA-binding transcriptional LysR family regulator
MNALQIRCFLTAARYLNFSESARRLYMSQATFSRNIALMESELGATLFVRSNKNVLLTHEGELALIGMKKIENAYVEMLGEITDFSKGICGSLSISVLEGQMLDPVLQVTIMRFEKECPGIQLTLSRESYRDLIDLLNAGKLDMAATLAFDVRQRQELCWRSVCRLKTLVVMPTNHRLAGKPGLRLKDFKNDVFIIPSEDDCKFCYAGLSANCIRSGFEPRILEAPDIRTQMLWLEVGRGISAANPNHMMCNSPALTEASIPEFAPEDFVIAWHGQNSNPALKCFLSIFEEIHTDIGNSDNLL